MLNKPIIFDEVFVKNYKKRVLKNSKLHQAFQEKMKIFTDNPNHPSLRNHKLKGTLREFRSFYIAPDCRVVYIEENELIYLLDIGKHDEVY